jgi:peptide deformylase
VYNRGLEKHHNVYDVDGVHARRVFTLQKPALNATIYSFLATFDALFRGYDVIHYHAIGPSVPLLIAKIFGKHTVCTVHGLNWKVDKWRGFASRYMKLETLIAHKDGCVGMAANMIGVAKRIIAFESEDGYLVMFNPVILKKSGPYETEEGCLSLTGTRKTKRFQTIKVQWQNEKFQPRIKTFSGWTAEIIQHELDHCDGIII